MATENVNMNIENTTTSASAQADANTRPSSGSVQLTPEMLSSAQVSVNMKFLADIRNVLDLATQRGAWRANELTAVRLIDSLDNAFRQLANKSMKLLLLLPIPLKAQLKLHPLYHPQGLLLTL